MAWALGIAVMAGLVVMAIMLTPTKVAYTEEVIIDAPVASVYDHIRFQERLMRWSAWPSETGSVCALEGQDGIVGARTVYYEKGERFGHQEIVELDPSRRVVLTLESKGPPQLPVLAFNLEPIGSGSARVVLSFVNEIKRPFNLLLRLAGIVRWTRAMHRKDLSGLKRYAEPPHQTYTGEPATELIAA